MRAAGQAPLPPARRGVIDAPGWANRRCGLCLLHKNSHANLGGFFEDTMQPVNCFWSEFRIN